MKLNSRIFATVSALALAAGALPTTANAASVPQEVLNNVIANILQSVRDQIQTRKLVVSSPGRMQFTGEEGQFNNRDPFAAQGVSNPFSALAYAKAPAMAPPAPAWIFGINAIGSGDRTYVYTGGTSTNIWSATGVGAFDATKIGIFTATDALTFVLTGSDTWAHIFNGNLAPAAINWFDSNTPAASGTVSYINGGFSADFTVSASWTHNSTSLLTFVAPPDTSALTYTGNAQYRFDFPYSVFFEPTGGVTYTELYTMNFGTKIGDNTEVHLGGRVGTEMKWMGFTVQPSLSGAVFRNVDCNGAACGTAGLPPGILPGAGAAVAGVTDLGLGGRGSGKINVIWTPHFSTYVEAHGSGYAGTKTQIIPATQTIGAQAGARYTW